MSENPIVEWQGKDGQKYRAIILRSFQFTGAHYIMGRMLDVPIELFVLAVEKGEGQTFLVINRIELECLISGLSHTMFMVSMDRLEQESKLRGLPA